MGGLAADSFGPGEARWVDRGAVDLLSQLGVRSWQEAMAAEVGQPLDKVGLERWRRRSRVVLKGSAGAEQVLYLKRFREPPLKAQIERVRLGAWRHGTAWVEWNNIRRLEAAGVPTMRPVAFAERVAGLWEVGSLLCTEQVAGESLERWLPKGWEPAVARFGLAWRRRVVVQLAEMVGRMHRANLCHRDLYTCHIFLELRLDGEACFRLIDLQRMFRLRLRKRRWWVKDLAALAASAPAGLVSRTDRMRFLRAYLGGRHAQIPGSAGGEAGVGQPGSGRGTRRETGDCPYSRAEVRRWWRDIEGKARRMMRHHEARMARLAER